MATTTSVASMYFAWADGFYDPARITRSGRHRESYAGDVAYSSPDHPWADQVRDCGFGSEADAVAAAKAYAAEHGRRTWVTRHEERVSEVNGSPYWGSVERVHIEEPGRQIEPGVYLATGRAHTLYERLLILSRERLAAIRTGEELAALVKAAGAKRATVEGWDEDFRAEIRFGRVRLGERWRVAETIGRAKVVTHNVIA
jgi:hypothetical protein